MRADQRADLEAELAGRLDEEELTLHLSDGASLDATTCLAEVAHRLQRPIA